MTRAGFLSLAAGLIASGCGPTMPKPAAAPAAFVLQADASGLSGPGYGAGASIGFEATDCCSMGTYASFWKLSDEAALEPEPDRAVADDVVRETSDEETPQNNIERILDGGLELGAVSPILTDQLRLRIRAGLAGTPPTTLSLGRTGFAGSVALIYRLTDAKPPQAGDAAPVFDLLAGLQVWSFESERTSAGSDDTSAGGVAGMVGVRIGAAYGIDLQ